MREILMAALAAFVATLTLSVTSANAKPFWEDGEAASHSRHSAHHARRNHSDDGDGESSGRRHSVGGRPGAWCGWYMRTQHGGGPEYNLAANWKHWGS